MLTSYNKHSNINVKDLSKTYTRNSDEGKKEFYALKDINLDIKKGEILGIIGPNGSGKSTLLKIMSEITAPSNGSIDIEGKVASILEVGTGFIPDLTGRKNIYLNARLHGMKKKEVDKKFNDIAEMFGFIDFLDTPVKQYSSGMYMRLAFAIVVHVNADIYLFDEVLSVGDIKFQQQSIKCIKELREKKRTIVIVTHSPDLIAEISDRILLLNKGQIIKIGKPEQLIQHYKNLIQGNDITKQFSSIIKANEIAKAKIVYTLFNGYFDLNYVQINSIENHSGLLSASNEIIIRLRYKTSNSNKLKFGIYINDSKFKQTIFSAFSEENYFTKDIEYESEFTLPRGFLNNITAYLGILIIENSKILINYPNLLYFKVSPPQGASVFQHIKGYISPSIICKTKQIEPK